MALKKRFDGATAFCRQTAYSDCRGEAKICDNYRGFADVGISDIFSGWVFGRLENNGVALVSNDECNDFFSLAANPPNCVFAPCLLFSYSCGHSHAGRDAVEIKDFHDDFHFSGETVTPFVNVEWLKMGTFFCHKPRALTA